MLDDQSLAACHSLKSSIGFCILHFVILFKNMKITHIIGSSSEFIYQQWFMTLFIFYICNHENMIET